MAYWGMAMSNVNNAKRARGFLKEARKRAEDEDHPSRDSSTWTRSRRFYKETGSDKHRRQNLLLGP